MMDGELFFFAAFFFKSKQEAFPGWVIVFDLEAHHRADPREGVGQGAEKSAIAETDMREDIDRVKQRLDLAVALYLNRRLPYYFRGQSKNQGCLRFKCSSVEELRPAERLPVHELSAVNGHSLRFKYRATDKAEVNKLTASPSSFNPKSSHCSIQLAIRLGELRLQSELWTAQRARGRVRSGLPLPQMR